MRKTAIVASIVFATAVAFSGTNASAGGEPEIPGEKTFMAKCASCHGKDASGTTAIGKKMALRDLGSEEVQKQTDKELHAITAKGKDKMPAYEKKLTEEQLKDLIMFIRSRAKKE